MHGHVCERLVSVKSCIYCGRVNDKKRRKQKNENLKRYRREKPEKFKEYEGNRNKSNSQRSKEYRDKPGVREAIKSKTAVWKKNNPDKISASKSRYYEKYKDKISAKIKADRKLNPQIFSEKRKKYVSDNKERNASR